MTRRHVGIGLVVAALVLVVAAFVMWNAETERVEDDQQAQDYAEAIVGRRLEDVEPSRTGPIAASAVAAVLFLAGVVVLVSPSGDS